MTVNHPSPPPPDVPPDATPAPTRRRWAGAIGATAGAAALAGLGFSLWREERNTNPQADAVVGTGGKLGDAFWSLQWSSPQGTQLAMRSFAGRPLLINFWATWCPPCVEELPLINHFYRQNKANGWQVLGLAVDKLAAVKVFLQKMPLDFPVAIAGLAGAELARTLGNVSGGLPFSVVIGREGSLLHRKLGLLSEADLDNYRHLK